MYEWSCNAMYHVKIFQNIRITPTFQSDPVLQKNPKYFYHIKVLMYLLHFKIKLEVMRTDLFWSSAMRPVMPMANLLTTLAWPFVGQGSLW